MKKVRFIYDAHCTAVYDGDTITVDIDLGFGNKMTGQKLRLYGVDTPEMRGDEREHGRKVRDWVREQILDKDVVLESIKDKTGKYGRWLARIWIGDVCLNEALIDSGRAEAYYP